MDFYPKTIQERTVESIWNNPDGTYTLKYSDGSFDYVADWQKHPGMAYTHSVGIGPVNVGVTVTDSDGTIAPFIGASISVEPVSYTFSTGDYDGDPASLQHVQIGVSGGVIWVGQVGLDLNSGTITGPGGFGTPQFGAGISLPLPLLEGPPMPEPENRLWADFMH